MVGKESKLIARIYKAEKDFITDIFGRLPQSAQAKFGVAPVPVEEEYVVASENNPKRKKFLEGLKAKRKAENEANGNENKKARVPLSHEQLQERLHAKIALLSKERVENGTSKKAIRRKLKRNEKDKAKADGKKKLISQKFTSTAAAAAPANNSNENPNPSSSTEKTPLQKKSVKTTNGEIVYSKFDFISSETQSKTPVDFSQKPKGDKHHKPDEILKSIEKNKSKLERLEKQGKTSEAVTMVDKQKWNNALQRAKGTKIKDDPTLLKRSIKKQDKIKKVKQKKWAERVEFQEKQKEQRITKRTDNIKARKDEKLKRSKKLQRKKGRIA